MDGELDCCQPKQTGSYLYLYPQIQNTSQNPKNPKTQKPKNPKPSQALNPLVLFRGRREPIHGGSYFASMRNDATVKEPMNPAPTTSEQIHKKQECSISSI